ncbi:uncharacterized protein LOC134745332 [Cydia strobilella]|uniref:uncharacterized protein LOC134745332 n=1 Tax=Cydia strobilella TaxID=1100964 RepID=UPI0030043CD5
MLLNFEFQDIVYWSNLLPCFEHEYNDIMRDVVVELVKFESKYDFLEFLDDKTDFVKLYTDGSKTKDRTSFAFFDSFLNIGKVFECSSYFSVFSAEVLGIIYALEHIRDNYITENKFLILSDSMSALQALKNKCVSASVNYLIYKLRSCLSSLLNRNITVEFCWVPGHSGIFGNELVDKLAKSTKNIQVCDLKVPQSDLVPFVKDLMIRRWNNLWSKSKEVKGKWLAEIVLAPSTKSWFEYQRKYVERAFITTMCRLRIGHARFPAHLFRLKLSDSAVCAHCNFNVCDLEHIFFHCPLFNLQRLLFVAMCLDTGLRVLPSSVQGLLKYQQLYPVIYEFVLHTIGSL